MLEATAGCFSPIASWYTPRSGRAAPDYASLAKLRYLGPVAHESLRLKTPVPFVALSAARDVTISDIEVPEGTPVFLLPREVARNAACFPDSDRFDPHRWLASDSAATRADFARASLPFGAGPRVCDFAMEPENLRVTVRARRAE